MAQTVINAAVYSSQMVGTVQDVSNVMAMTDQPATPFLSAISPDMNNLTKPLVNVTHLYHDMAARWARTTLNGALDNSTTTIVLSDAYAAQAGSVIQVDEETILLGSTSDGLTFTSSTRSVNQGSAAAHLDGAKVNVAGKPQVQGSSAGTPYGNIHPDEITTYVQTFAEDVIVPRVVDKIKMHWSGGQSEYDWEAVQKMKVLKKQVETASIWGTATAPSTNATAPKMGGLYERLYGVNVTDISDDNIEAEDIRAAIRAIADYSDDASPDFLFVNLKQNDNINTWNLVRQSLNQEEAKTYGEQCDRINIGGCSLIKVPMTALGAHAIILTSKFAKLGPLDPFSHKVYEDGTDNRKGRIIGDYTCEFLAARAHYMLTSCAVS